MARRANGCDYVVAILLTATRKSAVADNIQEASTTWSREEVASTRFVGLPLRVVYDGHRASVRPIGSVVALSSGDFDTLVLLEIDPLVSPEASFASSLVAADIYGWVSLSYALRGDSLTKHVFGVSLSREPRASAHILAYVPSRQTIDVLAMTPQVDGRYPSALDEMGDVYGYEPRGDGEHDDDYASRIDALAETRLRELIDKHRFALNNAV